MGNDVCISLFQYVAQGHVSLYSRSILSVLELYIWIIIYCTFICNTYMAIEESNL
jgi:hypothetical protein